MEGETGLVEHFAVNVVPEMDPVDQNGPESRLETRARRNRHTSGIENTIERTPRASGRVWYGSLPNDSEDENPNEC